jgi:serine/threonine protein phosphatase PrpC
MSKDTTDINFSYLKGIGPRSTMQDYGAYGRTLDECYWWVVCDGIGGYPCGKKAADIACRTIKNHFNKINTPKRLAELNKQIQTLCEVIQQKYLKAVQSGSGDEQMGTTFCFVLATPRKIFCAWAGDSRFYLVVPEKYVQSSLPHNISFDRYRLGDFSLEQAEYGSLNYLTASLSLKSQPTRFDSMELKRERHTNLLLATDGITGIMEPDEMLSYLMHKPIKMIKKEIKERLQEHAHDNYFGYFISF